MLGKRFVSIATDLANPYPFIVQAVHECTKQWPAWCADPTGQMHPQAFAIMTAHFLRVFN